MLAADNLYKQCGPRRSNKMSDLIWGSKLFDTDGIPERFFSIKVDFRKNLQTTKKHIKNSQGGREYKELRVAQG